VKVAKEAGYEPVFIDFSGIAWDKADLRDPDKMKELFAQTMLAAEKAISDLDITAEDKLLFISKSIGTAVAACYAKKKSMRVTQIYFSPVVQFGEFVQDYGLAFYGDNDPLADYRKIEEICAENKIEAHLIAGGNHSLEIGDTETDLNNLSKMIRLVKTFI
jgi:phosphoglycolate phosphatase